MSLLSNGKCNQDPGKIPTSSFIPNLPCDCLNIIYNRLKTKEDRNSFGLTCVQWFRIENNNRKSLRYYKSYATIRRDKRFPLILCKLLNRFQHLKDLYIIDEDDMSKITDFASSKPPFIECKVQYLHLDYHYDNSDIELPSIFSWFSRLTFIRLRSCYVTDKGLEALPKCCASLKEIRLSDCHSITDSGISFLLQNCLELSSLGIKNCSKVTGIGFLEFPKTLTSLDVGKCRFKPEGFKAIASGGGGLQYLSLTAPYEELAEAEEGSINTETIVAISKGCPLLKKLSLFDCSDVELEGWEAIGRNCTDLELLGVLGCRKLCDLGLQALCNGCNKLSTLSIYGENSCSSSALELFKSKKPQCTIYSNIQYGKRWN